jgi:hypothetical protein
MAPVFLSKSLTNSFGPARKALVAGLLLAFLWSLFPMRAFASQLRDGTLPDLASFEKSVENNVPGTLRGVYADGLFALPVIQQPGYGSYYISTKPDTVTEFGAAAAYGNVGLLAHDFLSGQLFPQLGIGQPIELVYGDGHIEYFTVTQVLKYQATDPYSTQSDFVDLSTQERLTSVQLFKRVYMGARHVTFQTCIEENGNSSWGRLFVIAQPRQVSTGAGQ